ncbi:MAG: hypothetical protein E7617_02255 [Ruminococcaceae bacterium]|nr:hypothetical protein [Oscillospiraceae bacterium]
MKKELRIVMILLLSIGIILNLCSCPCHLAESYKEFNIKNITGDVNENYFTSEEFAFARIQNVVIIPQVKAINHGVYVVYVDAYSKSGKETVIIKNVLFKENETVLFKNELGNTIEFEQNTNSIYEGYINGGTFTEESVQVADGKKYDIIIEVDVFDEGLNFSKNLTFEVNIKGYNQMVCPT